MVGWLFKVLGVDLGGARRRECSAEDCVVSGRSFVVGGIVVIGWGGGDEWWMG